MKRRMQSWDARTIAFMRDAEAHNAYTRELAEWILPHLNADDAVCEAGCGLGQLALALAGAVRSYTAFDRNADALSDLREGDVFFAISMPRYLQSTIHATALAHESGIPTIVITDSLGSPLIPYTTIPLIVDNEIFSYCDNTVPIVATITALLNSVGSITHPRSNIILAKNEETWNRFNLYFK